jgi:gas vesicle protein
MNDMNTQRILLAALAALVAGIGIGLLLAPNRGSETWQLIIDSAGKLTKRFRNNGHEEFSDSEMEMDARSGNSFSN